MYNKQQICSNEKYGSKTLAKLAFRSIPVSLPTTNP